MYMQMWTSIENFMLPSIRKIDVIYACILWMAGFSELVINFVVDNMSM